MMCECSSKIDVHILAWLLKKWILIVKYLGYKIYQQFLVSYDN
jgi:hypothetical protein